MIKNSLFIVATCFFAVIARAQPAYTPPPSYLNAISKPYGLVQADANGAEPRSEDQRAPTAFDDWTRGYAPGDGSSKGPLWQYNNAIWQLYNTIPAYQQSDWFRVAAPLPCDPGALSVSAGSGGSGCGVYYGTVKGVSAYAGNAMTLFRASDQTTLAIPFVARNGYYVADQNMMNRFCAGSPQTQRCWATVVNEQTGAGYNMVPAYSGAASASTAPTAQAGTFTNSSLITLADTGGTCTVHTIIAVDTQTSGTITTSHINQYSRCTVIPTNGTQASASVTGGGTSASYTMTYGYPEAMEYLPFISINGLPALTCAGLGSGQGPDLINQQHACTMNTPTAPWQPHNALIAGAMTTKGAQTTSYLVTSPDGTYGWKLTGVPLVPGMIGMNNVQCYGLMPLVTPNVAVFQTTGTGNGYCWENNEYLHVTGVATTSESATGMQWGGANGTSFTFTSLLMVPAATVADANVVRIGLTQMSAVQPQVRTFLDVSGASMTYGAGQGDAQNYTTVGNFAYRRGVQEINYAQSSQQLCGAGNEDANFLTANSGDSLMYQPFGSINIILNVGEMNDVGNSSANTIHGCRAHLMYQWQQLATGYFVANVGLATLTGVSGYATNEVITLAPPAGATCTTAPQVTVLSVGSAGAGIPAASSYVSNGGRCTDANSSGAGTWTQASTTGVGTGATFTVAALSRSPVVYISGETPPQCGKWTGNPPVQATLDVIYNQYNDIFANLNTPQPTGGCSTATTCTAVTGGYAGGAGLRPAGMQTTAFNDYAADPIVGFSGLSGNIAFPGPFIAQTIGTNYPAGNYPLRNGVPAPPFCNTALSGTGDHPSDLSAQLMFGNLQAVVNSVLPAP